MPCGGSASALQSIASCFQFLSQLPGHTPADLRGLTLTFEELRLLMHGKQDERVGDPLIWDNFGNDSAEQDRTMKMRIK